MHGYKIDEIVKGRNAGTFRIVSFSKPISGVDMVRLKEVAPFNHSIESPSPEVVYTFDMIKKIEPGVEKTVENSWVMYYELHVDDQTFVVHKIIFAETREDAEVEFNREKSKHGENYHLQVKGGVFPLLQNLSMLAEI